MHQYTRAPIECFGKRQHGLDLNTLRSDVSISNRPTLAPTLIESGHPEKTPKDQNFELAIQIFD